MNLPGINRFRETVNNPDTNLENHVALGAIGDDGVHTIQHLPPNTTNATQRKAIVSAFRDASADAFPEIHDFVFPSNNLLTNFRENGLSGHNVHQILHRLETMGGLCNIAAGLKDVVNTANVPGPRPTALYANVNNNRIQMNKAVRTNDVTKVVLALEVTAYLTAECIDTYRDKAQTFRATPGGEEDLQRASAALNATMGIIDRLEGSLPGVMGVAQASFQDHPEQLGQLARVEGNIRTVCGNARAHYEEFNLVVAINFNPHHPVGNLPVADAV